ncbi:probable 30S ribosomal protein S3 [Thermoplasma acidophilum]|uniref:Small ribosomal subunit protein uS3 n=1 Tax=Thermoplasma acidophilum (strain ATCC 25905 / DSM 1728 / JCM 9062 / NBRC 15155 / AMRC-C165) TaxID=273075 RepID=RS3_THEAC|nr:30S ribosomal protein S3 [Thermoplasma acidophilum]Q9HIR5.1 RecName: Full=Small ribosomal subunit protein uS3; AltName: Full=30S ribosomal protein S3 [Thermoplasma acidophilum DSM 1728]CAC12389.1 probable 30S ribosomal protein S3 [Thermoplasma acidophilum]
MKERKFINEAVKRLLVCEYVVKETENAGFGNMVMKRTPFGTNITLYVNRPGLVIGRRGSKVQQMTDTLEKKYGIETPQIEVKDVKDPDLNPSVIAKKIALSLEKGWSYRKAGNTSLNRTIQAGAKGVLIKISGKISGERARYQKFIYGNVKYSGEPGSKGMITGFSTAKLKVGILGVTVKILNPEYKLPDVFSIENITGGEEVGTESKADQTDVEGRETGNAEES